MRIVHVAIRFPPAAGGGEQYVYNLAKQQVKMGNRVWVITTDLMKEVPREVDKSLPKREVIDGINVIRMKTYPTGLPVWGYGSIVFGLKKTINKLKPDIVQTHAYGYFHSDVLVRLRRKSGWKIVMVSLGFPSGRGVFKVVKEVYTKFVGKKIIKNLDAAVALSERDKKVFEDMGAKNVYVIPNGIDLAKFENPPSRDIFRDKYEIKERMILNVGRLQKIKGQEILIKAFSNVIKDFPDTTLVIVGEDWGEKKNLEMLVKNLGLEDRIIMPGSVSTKELLSAYAGAEIFVLPSLNEGLPTVILEAMACRSPIIATDVGGVAETVDKAGLVIEPKKVNRLAKAIKKLLEDEKLRKRFSELGRERVKRYDWPVVAKNVVDIYKELLGM